MKSDAGQIRVCARCGKGEAAAKHAWCKACKANYQKDYLKVQIEMAEKRAYLRGCEALRQSLMRQFAARARGMIFCGEVALYLKDFPRPDYTAQDTDTESLPPAPNT